MHSSKTSQIVRILDEEGRVMQDLEVNPKHSIEIQIDTATSEVHLIHDSSKQSHIVDDCESDVEMPSTRPKKNLEGFDRGQTERDELEIHLNATLSEASQLTKEQRRQ